MGQNKSPIYISLAEAARLAGLSRKYWNVLVWRKKIRAEKIGGQWFMTLPWLNDYLRSVHRPEVTEEQASRAAVANGEASPQIEQRLDVLGEKIDALLNGSNGNNGAKEDYKFADAYIEQTKFLQEQFGKVIDKQFTAPSIIPDLIGDPELDSRPPIVVEGGLRGNDNEIIELQARIDALQIDLHQEQADKQALLFELQRLHEQMEETIAHRLAAMAEELNQKIQEVKVTERLDQMKENFDRSVIPAAAGIQNQGMDPRVKPGDDNVVKEPEHLPLPPPAEPVFPLRSTPLRRRIKYHAVNIWDRIPNQEFHNSYFIIPSAIIAALLFVNFAAPHADQVVRYLQYPSELGLAYGDAVVEAGEGTKTFFNSQFLILQSNLNASISKRFDTLPGPFRNGSILALRRAGRSFENGYEAVAGIRIETNRNLSFDKLRMKLYAVSSRLAFLSSSFKFVSQWKLCYNYDKLRASETQTKCH